MYLLAFASLDLEDCRYEFRGYFVCMIHVFQLNHSFGLDAVRCQIGVE